MTIAAGFVVPLWSETLADEIQTVSTEEAMETARLLAREESIFAGTSSGGNTAVALRVAERLGPDHTVVTVAVDSGMKYLGTVLYGGTESAERILDERGGAKKRLDGAKESR